MTKKEPDLMDTLERAWYNIAEQHGFNQELVDDIEWLVSNIASYKTIKEDKTQ